MKITVEMSQEEKEKLIIDVMENYPEASSPSLQCIGWKYNEMKFVFLEDGNEKDTRHEVDLPMLTKGLDKLFEKIIAGKYINHMDLIDMVDPGNWDATDCDALVQCAIFNEIIYG